MGHRNQIGTILDQSQNNYIVYTWVFRILFSILLNTSSNKLVNDLFEETFIK